jgi:DNA-directed RNA polymerase specialized sigma24 family protein
MPSDFRNPAFPVTRRSAVAAVGSDDAKERARAFEVLVRAYWRPIYKHLRMKWQYSESDAADFTQGFFARAFDKHWFIHYRPEKALFRTYLRVCLDRHVMSERRDSHRDKRGAETVRVSLDFECAESELGFAKNARVDEVFDAEWVRVLFGTALEALEAQAAREGKDAHVRAFRRYVIDADDDARPSYAEMAAELGVKVTDITNYLSWARREFRRLTLETLRDLTTDEDEWRSEARAWLGVDP